MYLLVRRNKKRTRVSGREENMTTTWHNRSQSKDCEAEKKNKAKKNKMALTGKCCLIKRPWRKSVCTKFRKNLSPPLLLDSSVRRARQASKPYSCRQTRCSWKRRAASSTSWLPPRKYRRRATSPTYMLQKKKWTRGQQKIIKVKWRRKRQETREQKVQQKNPRHPSLKLYQDLEVRHQPKKKWTRKWLHLKEM